MYFSVIKTAILIHFLIEIAKIKDIIFVVKYAPKFSSRCLLIRKTGHMHKFVHSAHPYMLFQSGGKWACFYKPSSRQTPREYRKGKSADPTHTLIEWEHVTCTGKCTHFIHTLSPPSPSPEQRVTREKKGVRLTAKGTAAWDFWTLFFSWINST